MGLGGLGLGAWLTGLVLNLFSAGASRNAAKEAARRSGFAHQYQQEIQADPEKWMRGLSKELGPLGPELGKRALAGTLTQDELANVLGVSDIAGQEAAFVGDDYSQYIPGEREYPERVGPVRLHANREGLMELVQGATVTRQRIKVMNDMMSKGVSRQLADVAFRAVIDPQFIINRGTPEDPEPYYIQDGEMMPLKRFLKGRE